MKLDELKTDDDLTALIAKATEEAVAEAKKGLLHKNQELLDEVKGLKKFKDVDVDGLIEAKKELETLKTKKLESEGEYKKLYETQQEQHQVEVQKMADKLGTVEGEFKNLLVHGQLTQELAKAGVKSSLLDVATDHLASKVSVIDQDGKRVARVGEKSISDFVNEWKGSDLGKEFVTAPDNTGGGAGGSGDGSFTGYEDYFKPETKNLTKQGEVYKRDPKLYERLKKQYSNAKPDQS